MSMLLIPFLMTLSIFVCCRIRVEDFITADSHIVPVVS
jgi:hypothetical protein